MASRLILTTVAIWAVNASFAAGIHDLPQVDVEALSRAIVSVQTQGIDSGSGVVVSSTGLVLTASTLLAKERRLINVRFVDGRTYMADVIAVDRGTESALLRIQIAKPRVFSFLALGESSKLPVGARAISAGNPLDSITVDHQLSLSVGSITGIGTVHSCDAASCYSGSAFETDAAINAGSEGGALLDESGQVIGMTCLCVDRARMKGTAIPSDRLRAAYKQYLDAVSFAPDVTAAASDPYGRALRATVRVSASANWLSSAAVNGILIDANGHVLTTGLFEEGQRVEVDAAGETLSAVVERQSSALDVSLLRIVDVKTPGAWIPATMQAAIVPGMQLSIVSKGTTSASMVRSIVSAVDRLDGSAVQTDARLNECDAGGGVLNAAGELIGIVSHSGTVSHYGGQNAGVSFFTPTHALKSWLEETATPRKEDSEPLAEIVARSAAAFVFIGDGSGVVIREDGYALTNYHVAGSRATWRVRLGNESATRECDVIETDPALDLCLVKVRGVEHACCIKFGDSGRLTAAQCVLALGDPFKLGELRGGPAASFGIISALHRNQGRYRDAIQTDCAINPGNSGGPLLNLAGELVGLNGQIVSRYGRNNTGVAFAIPIDQIKTALERFHFDAESQSGYTLISAVTPK